VGLALSVLMYADDILNQSHTFSGYKSKFSKLIQEYEQIGLSFNMYETVAVGFNLEGCSDKSF
jgi:hypothetical protein